MPYAAKINEGDRMYLLVEANTQRGRRHFIIGGDAGKEAEALMRAFIEEDNRIMDRSGEWFEASEIDVASVVANRVLVPANEPVSGRFADDGERLM
jgi:hypothetical protein